MAVTEPRPKTSPAPAPWRRRPWVAPLAALILVFFAMSLPRYATLDPALSRVPPVEGFALHHPLLVAHILFGTVAMVTGFLQVWPWFRRRFPAAHRHVGRVYVFGGVLPAGLAGLVVGAVSPFGPVTRVSNVVLALLWLAFTATGLRRIRQRRHAEHRVWMLRSVTLTMSIIFNRLVGMVVGPLLGPRVDTLFGGDELAMMQTVALLSAWLGWVVPLAAVEWWLRRGSRRAQSNTRQTGRV